MLPKPVIYLPNNMVKVTIMAEIINFEYTPSACLILLTQLIYPAFVLFKIKSKINQNFVFYK